MPSTSSAATASGIDDFDELHEDESEVDCDRLRKNLIKRFRNLPSFRFFRGSDVKSRSFGLVERCC